MILRIKQGWLGDWETRVGGVVAKKTHPFQIVQEFSEDKNGLC
jgi:hypothetical protein